MKEPKLNYYPRMEVLDLPESPAKVAMSTVEDSSTVFDEDSFGVDAQPVPGWEKSFQFIPFGPDNRTPYHLAKAIAIDEIMSQNMFFNVLTAYGSGLRCRTPRGCVN